MKPKTGWVYTKDKHGDKARLYIYVYPSLQELRLCCGEVPSKDIVKVIVTQVKDA